MMGPNRANCTAIDQILRRMPTTTFTPPQVMLPTEAMGNSGEFTGRWIVGLTMLHAAIIDGTLAQWVRRLEAS